MEAPMFKAVIFAYAMYVASVGPNSPLSVTDPVSKWPYVLEAERQKIVSLLVTLVGRGQEEMNEHFFEECISEAAWEPNLHDEQIREAATACAYMSTLVFTESG
jgi:hypothetical protein